jgi:hypothetical protein
MSTPTVIEARFAFEPVTSDTFVADLDHRSPEAQARLAALVSRAAAAPNRRIYD